MYKSFHKTLTIHLWCRERAGQNLIFENNLDLENTALNK